MKTKIIDMDHLGRGIGKIDNKVIFIPKTVYNDECEIEIEREYKNYSVGKLTSIIKKSDLRVEAKCPYYKICGGCNISNLDYDQQLLFKENKVKNIFKKYLDMDIDLRIIGSKKQDSYRNKISYHYDNNKIGLISEDNKVIDIDSCLLVSNKVNELYQLIKEKDISLVKLITIRECDNGLILIITGKIDITDLKDKCIAIYMNNKCVYKKSDGYIMINDIKYMISDKSFFQINTSNIDRLYDVVVEYGNFTKNDKVIDLYCGVGSISLYIAKYVKEVLGIEIIPEAINDAKENARINNINNVKFLCGDVAKLIDDNIDCNTLIVDPPRGGLDKHSVDVINNRKINKLIYVSCDVMTLVRDIKLLDNYKIEKITAVDMFPQTSHIESLIVLERRNS